MNGKRLGSIVLALVLSFGLLTASAGAIEPQRVKGLTPQIAKGYLDVVDGLMEEYGGYSVAQPEDFYQPYTAGVAGGFVRDFDQNGTPEMVVLLAEGGTEGTFRIYTWKDGGAVQIGVMEYVSLSLMRSGSFDYSVINLDGTYYLRETGGDVGNAGATWFSYTNCYTVRNGAWVQAVNTYYDDYNAEDEEMLTEIKEMLGDSYSPTSSVVIDGQETYCGGWDDYNQAVGKYRTAEGECILSDEEELVPFGQELYAMLSEVAKEAATPEPTPAITFPEGITPQELLAAVSYYGDTAKCRMNSAQAKAFAQVLSDLPGTYTTKWGATYETRYAALADVAGDGYPLLFTVYSSGDSEDEYYAGIPAFGGNLQIWTWNGTSVSAHPIAEDLGVFTARDLTLGTHEGTAVLQVSSPITSFGDASAYAYYAVDRGEMTLLHKTESFSVWGDESGGSGEFIRNGELGYYEVTADELKQKGWTYVKDNATMGHWELQIVNGERQTEPVAWEFMAVSAENAPQISAGHDYTGIYGDWCDIPTLSAALTRYATIAPANTEPEPSSEPSAEPETEPMPGEEQNEAPEEAPEEPAQATDDVTQEEEDEPEEEKTKEEASASLLENPVFWIAFIAADVVVIAALICVVVVLKRKNK